MYAATIPPGRRTGHSGISRGVSRVPSAVMVPGTGEAERGCMDFVVVAQYRAREGEAERVAEALRNMVAPTRAEPGNLDYQVFRDPKDPSQFVLYERYAG